MTFLSCSVMDACGQSGGEKEAGKEKAEKNKKKDKEKERKEKKKAMGQGTGMLIMWNIFQILAEIQCFDLF